MLEPTRRPLTASEQRLLHSRISDLQARGRRGRAVALPVTAAVVLVLWAMTMLASDAPRLVITGFWLVFGVGHGWIAEESEIFGVPFKDRVRRATETVKALKTLWREEEPSFAGEFVAFQACGVSMRRLLRPVGLVSILCFSATLYILLVSVPASNQRFREITFNIIASLAEGEVKPRVFYERFPNIDLYVREVPQTGGWNGVFMSDNRSGDGSTIYLAKRGRVVIDRRAHDREPDASRDGERPLDAGRLQERD